MIKSLIKDDFHTGFDFMNSIVPGFFRPQRDLSPPEEKKFKNPGKIPVFAPAISIL